MTLGYECLGCGARFMTAEYAEGKEWRALYDAERHTSAHDASTDIATITDPDA